MKKGFSFESNPADWFETMAAARWPRADSHIHLVRPDGDRGWAEQRKREGTTYNEPVQYNTFAQKYGVEAVLVVSVGADNDGYIAEAGRRYSWCRGLASFEPAQLTVPRLEALSSTFSPDSAGKLAGIALSAVGGAEALAAVDPTVWAYIDKRRWLISQNNSKDGWLMWLPVLHSFPTLRLLIAHCGLPGASPESERDDPAPPDVYARRLASVLQLSRFPGPRVKLSGFYALTNPSHDFPHRGAWGLVEALMAAFGVERLLWGSDFSPVLGHLSFPQTIDLFQRMPFLSVDDRRQIEGENLLTLLAEIDGSSLHAEEAAAKL